MKLLRIAVAALAFSGAGCTWPTATQTRVVYGTVTYLDGRTVERAQVTVDGGGTTYTDVQGRYRIGLPPGPRAVTLRARDGFTPGWVYAVTHFSTVVFNAGGGSTRQDIVLDMSGPI